MKSWLAFEVNESTYLVYFQYDRFEKWKSVAEASWKDACWASPTLKISFWLEEVLEEIRICKAVISQNCVRC